MTARLPRLVFVAVSCAEGVAGMLVQHPRFNVLFVARSGTEGRRRRRRRHDRRPLPRPPCLDAGGLAELAGAWTDRGGRVRPEWTRWRAFLDRLAQEPNRVPEAIYASPLPAGHPVIDTLLAAVAEELADEAGLRRPSWTEAVPPLAERWEPPTRGTHHDIPEQFAARGLMLDAGSLFRDPATIGA